MSVNTAHAENGVLIHAGEAIILFSDNVSMDFSGQDSSLFKGSKNGKMYLTTHRMIFNAKSSSEPMKSFSFPFICLTDVEIEQPVFGSNYIRGKVRAQENGQFTGEAKFKLHFKSGGAIDFAQAALKAAYIAKKYGNNAAPPPYTPPTGGWHEAPPPAYSPNPNGYYGWVPNTQAFPNGPPPNTVFMSDNPPPYPGIVYPGAVPTPNGYAGGPPSYPGAYGANQGYAGYPGGQPDYQGNQNGYPGAQPGYPGAQPGYPGAQTGYPGAQPGYPGAQTGYPGAQPGYPGAQPGYPGGQPGYPAGQPGYPQGGQAGYPGAQTGYPGAQQPTLYPQVPSGGAGGVTPNVPYSKENEANQATQNPSAPPQFAPPPGMWNEQPPSYSSLQSNKKQQ